MPELANGMVVEVVLPPQAMTAEQDAILVSGPPGPPGPEGPAGSAELDVDPVLIYYNALV